MNPLDHKPFKNSFAGKGVKTKQHFKPNSNLSGYGKGTDVAVKGNKLAMPVTRTGSSTGKLVKRTYTDAAPGLQGGLRETVGILEEINEFCSASLQEMGFRGTAKDNFEAPERGMPSVSAGQRTVRKDEPEDFPKVRVGTAIPKAGGSPKRYSLVDPYWAKQYSDQSRRKLGIDDEGFSMGEAASPSKSGGFNDLIVKIRHARKTGDKAKEAMAKDELERLAVRHNKMKDPEVLDALS